MCGYKSIIDENPRKRQVKTVYGGFDLKKPPAKFCGRHIH